MYKKQKVNIQSSQFKPHSDSLLVKVSDISEETINDIIVALGPKSVMDRPTQGIAVRVGEDIPDIKVGDEAFWDVANGVDFIFDDGNFVLLRYNSVLCIRPA
jgi:co-chaperonin GroES (HSP10)